MHFPHHDNLTMDGSPTSMTNPHPNLVACDFYELPLLLSNFSYERSRSAFNLYGASYGLVTNNFGISL